jgi:hypothetical protein
MLVRETLVDNSIRLPLLKYPFEDIRNCFGRNLRFNGIKRFVKYEVKAEKYEYRLFVSRRLVKFWLK